MAGLTTPSFLTFDNMLGGDPASVGHRHRRARHAYVTIGGNLFALSAEELSFSTGLHLRLADAGQAGASSLSLRVTLLFSGVGGAVQGGIIALGADPIITTFAFGGFFRRPRLRG